MKFWLGTHKTGWLGKLDVPLFVSHRQLAERKSLPRARAEWALDSGGFTELSMYGDWRTTVDEYVEAVDRYAEGVGRLAWAAPMDWMCEPIIREGGTLAGRPVPGTGLSVREHQERTVQNFLDLRDRGPFIPVIQGWSIDDYTTCVDLYQQAGVDLAAEPIVGVGSVCRRQNTTEIAHIFHALSAGGIRCHGFGVKKEGLTLFDRYLESADSMAWSFRARYDHPLPGCTHARCNNCPKYALKWRAELLAPSDQMQLVV